MWGASWFGGNTAQKRKDAPKKAILDLRQQLEMLQKRERYLQSQMDKQDEVARANVSSNKAGKWSCIPGVLGGCWMRVDKPVPIYECTVGGNGKTSLT